MNGHIRYLSVPGAQRPSWLQRHHLKVLAVSVALAALTYGYIQNSNAAWADTQRERGLSGPTSPKGASHLGAAPARVGHSPSAVLNEPAYRQAKTTRLAPVSAPLSPGRFFKGKR